MSDEKPGPYEANYEAWAAVWHGSGEEWPRRCTGIDCPNCDQPIAVMQTSYGARATCRDCSVRWTTLFSERGAWTDETYSPITDNTTIGRSEKDRATAAGRVDDSAIRDGDE